jgi:hypothetical protein
VRVTLRLDGGPHFRLRQESADALIGQPILLDLPDGRIPSVITAALVLGPWLEVTLDLGEVPAFLRVLVAHADGFVCVDA